MNLTSLHEKFNKSVLITDSKTTTYDDFKGSVNMEKLPLSIGKPRASKSILPAVNFKQDQKFR